jgi:hypothetical protein
VLALGLNQCEGRFLTDSSPNESKGIIKNGEFSEGYFEQAAYFTGDNSHISMGSEEYIDFQHEKYKILSNLFFTIFLLVKYKFVF